MVHGGLLQENNPLRSTKDALSPLLSLIGYSYIPKGPFKRRVLTHLKTLVGYSFLFAEEDTWGPKIFIV